MKRYIAIVALPAVAAVGALLSLGHSSVVRAADGGGTCTGGKLVEAVNIKAGTTVIGLLRLFYIPSTRSACAVTLHSGPTTNVVASTGVLIAESTPPSGDYTQAAYQRGNYRTQAGPIRAITMGRCYYAGGGITYRGTHHTVYTGVHC